MTLTDFERELFFGPQDDYYDSGVLSQDEINKLLTESNDPMFVHLHVHSDYSIGKSTASVSALVDKAIKMKMTHLALTDSGNMSGIMEFLETIEKKDASLRPIIGCEVFVESGSRFEKDEQCYHLVLLAENRQGYLNLMKLCSLGFIDDELLEQYHEGLIALSGCMEGEIPALIRNGELKKAEEKAVFYQNLFGKRNFFLEIQDYGIPEQKNIIKAIADISMKTNIPMVATNNVHCINGRENYLKSREDMIALFKDYPKAIENTVWIANRCSAAIPKYEVQKTLDNLPCFETPDLEVSASFLQRLTEEGINCLYSKEKSENGKEWEEIKKRVKHELSVIIKFNLSNYFLIVQDFVYWANIQGIPVGYGRNTAAGSIVAYALGITSIDPLKYGLLFERFINPERISIPDIDIDFSFKDRDKVINYVTTQYGKENVGRVITFGKKEGIIHHYGTHAAGLVIAKSAISDFVPVIKDKFTGNIITQYGFQYLETCGLIKFDFLGLEYLDKIGHIAELIRLHEGELYDFLIQDIPEDDPKTFELFKEGNTDGVLWFESEKMKEFLKLAKPDKFSDLIALYAFYRPGPMDFIPLFIDFKNGKQKINHLHLSLKDILEETYGLIVYQEQIIQIINRITGYSLGKADILRRIFLRNRHDTEVNLDTLFDGDATYTLLKSKFICDAIGNGFITDENIDKEYEQVQKIFDALFHASSCCFLKSHAVAYTKLAYQSAYLKANFRKEWGEAFK